MQSYRGRAFSGVEIIFSIAVIGTIVVNSLILTHVSAKNNIVTENLATATKLVQESVKEIVHISGKKTDKLIIINGHSYSWPELFNNNLSFSSCKEPLNPESTCSDFLLLPCPPGTYSDKSRCITRDTRSLNMHTREITQDSTHFFQKIRIIDAKAQAKKITVLVWWNDSLGLHKSAITRTLKR